MKERGFVPTKITALILSFLAATLSLIGYADILPNALPNALLNALLQVGFYTLWIIYLFVSKNRFKRSVLLSLAFACVVTKGLFGIIDFIGPRFRMEYMLQSLFSSFLIPFAIDLLVMIFSFVGVRRKGFITALFADVFFSIGSAFSVVLTMIINHEISGFTFINSLSALFIDVALLIFAIQLIPREAAATTAPAAPACPTCGAPVAPGAAFCTNCGSKVN